MPNRSQASLTERKKERERERERERKRYMSIVADEADTSPSAGTQG